MHKLKRSTLAVIIFFLWKRNCPRQKCIERDSVIIFCEIGQMKKEKKYSKQRNYCLFVKKNKTNYCSNFNEINVNDTSQKVYVFAKITPYMCISKRKLLINAFFKARFSYCPPAWVCYSCLMNNKINRHVLGLFVMIKRCLLWIFLKNMDLSPYAKEICKLLLLKSLKYIRKSWQNAGTFYNRSSTPRNRHRYAIPLINSVYHGSESI